MKKNNYNGISNFLIRYNIPTEQKNIIGFTDVNKVMCMFLKEQGVGAGGLEENAKLCQDNFSKFSQFVNKKYIKNYNTMKNCIKCNASKPLDQFYDKGKYKDSSCKSCKIKLMKEQRDKNKSKPRKTCTSCKKTYKSYAFIKDNKSYNQCLKCRNYLKKISPKKTKDDRKLESIFEAEHRLKKDAKKISYNNVEVEKEKIKDGYSWVNDVINRGTAFESKVRVLRKIA